MILGTWELLNRNPNPTEHEVRDMLSGILDRETAYVKPVEAVMRAAALMRGETNEPFGPVYLPLSPMERIQLMSARLITVQMLLQLCRELSPRKTFPTWQL